MTGARVGRDDRRSPGSVGSPWSARLGAGGCGIGLGCVKAGVQLPPGAFLVAVAEQIGCFAPP